MEEIKSFKKDSIKESTLIMYVNNLNKLKELFNADSYDFLDSPEDVFDKIKNLRFTTQKTIINSVIVYIQAIDASGIISDKQKDNFATTEEIVKMVKVMKKSLNSIKKSQQEIKGNDYELNQAYMLFNIYLKLPLRNDVAGMISIKASDFKKIKDNTEINYIVLSKSKMEIVLNDYKTSGKRWFSNES